MGVHGVGRACVRVTCYFSGLSSRLVTLNGMVFIVG